MKKAGDFVLLEAGQKIRIIYSEKRKQCGKMRDPEFSRRYKKSV